MKFTRISAAALAVVTAGVASTAISAAPPRRKGGGAISAQRSSGRTVTIKIGQGVDFARGRMTRRSGEAGLVFQYMAPQDTSGMKFNGATGQLEYRAGMKITEFIPLLSAAHSAKFATRPKPGQFTSGDVNGWTEDDVPQTGAWYVVQSKLDDQHYLIRVTQAFLPRNQPDKWSVTLTYEPYRVPAGGAGAKNAPTLAGTLRFKNLHTDKLIVDYDMATGRMRQVADGYALNMNARGDMAYRDSSDALILTDAVTKKTKRMRMPGDSPVLSPDGKRLAIEESRSKTYDTSFGKFTSAVGLGHVVVYDVATGKELAVFPDKNDCEWTPDGRLVMGEYGGKGLYISDANLEKLTTLDADIHGPSLFSVSPDGKQIAFVAGGRVWTIGTDGSDLKQAAATGRAQSVPAWSPDGKWIAFSEETHSLRTDVRAVRLSDGELITLATSTGSPLSPMSRMFWRK